MTLTLTEFLLARIDYAELEAITAIDLNNWQEPGTKHVWKWLHAYKRPGSPGWSSNHHEGAPSPHRVLAECESKRRIVELHTGDKYYVYEDTKYACETCGDGTIKWPCDTLRLLALPYADHIDYREEWKP